MPLFHFRPAGIALIDLPDLPIHHPNEQVLFISSTWANAEAICIGGNANTYGPHEYSWYNEDVPYLFVSYDDGHSKAFLDCNGLHVHASSEAHLEINGVSNDAGSSAAPNVSFQQDMKDIWSIDEWGSVKMNSDCQWYTDAAVGLTATADTSTYMAVDKDFGQLALSGVTQDTDKGGGVHVEQEGERTKYVRSRWNENGGDDKQAGTMVGASSVIQPRGVDGGDVDNGYNGKGKGKGGSKAPTVSKAPKGACSGKGKGGKGKGGKGKGGTKVSIRIACMLCCTDLLY